VKRLGQHRHRHFCTAAFVNWDTRKVLSLSVPPWFCCPS
jgi:hypothetical protein